MADVFISYAQARRELTENLAEDLKLAGFSVWWDTSLLPNQRFRTAIDEQLDSSKAVIIIWTPESIKSDWVLSEADDARAQGKLINTYVEDLRPHQIPKPFNEIHAVKLTNREAILTAVQEAVHRPPLPAVPEAAGFYRRFAMAGAIVGVVVIALVLAVFGRSFRPF